MDSEMTQEEQLRLLVSMCKRTNIYTDRDRVGQAWYCVWQTKSVKSKFEELADALDNNDNARAVLELSAERFLVSMSNDETGIWIGVPQVSTEGKKRYLVPLEFIKALKNIKA